MTTTTRRSPGRTLALLAFAQLIVSVDYNIVYVALPEIGAALGFTTHGLQWVISGYAVAFGGFLLLGGRASDLFGPRRMFVLGLSLYAASSLAGGLAQDPRLLVAARAVQGVGGAFLFPATLTLVGTSFTEGRERNRAFAVWGTAGGSGMILGSLLGGVLTDAFGWAAVFYVNVPPAALAALLALPLLAPDAGHRTAGRRFDAAGALTATAGTTLLVLALVQGPEAGWTSAAVLSAAAAGLVLLTAFAAVERRGADPLTPPRLLRNSDLSTAMAVTFAFMATLGTLLYFLTVYFQTVHGYSALRTGLAFLVPTLAIAAGSQTAGRLANRYGLRATIVTALAVAAAGTALTALPMAADASYLSLVPGLVVLGIGQGACYSLMFGAAGTGVAAHEQGVAAGLASTTQQLGGAVGLAVLVAVAGPAGSVTGLRTAVFAAAAGTAVTALVALRFTRPAPSAPSAPVARGASPKTASRVPG
ncbi:MFS transporter [Streptomyces sp. NPDC020731]|uniref:MFS transporter n=1 Tax=Streptomyces sp. NPDC020731 TaxID=3365085 RepID=UPI0037A1180C